MRAVSIRSYFKFHNKKKIKEKIIKQTCQYNHSVITTLSSKCHYINPFFFKSIFTSICIFLDKHNLTFLWGGGGGGGGGERGWRFMC